MLALDEGAFARLFIAASAVAPSRRSRWLQSIARELEGHPPSATARRLRRLQARRRNGQKCYRLVEDEVDLVEMLISAGTLAASDCDDHGKVEAALSKFLRLVIEDHRNAFQHDREICDRVRVGLCLSVLRKKVPGDPPQR
jgi:hypothetical protein